MVCPRRGVGPPGAPGDVARPRSGRGGAPARSNGCTPPPCPLRGVTFRLARRSARFRGEGLPADRYSRGGAGRNDAADIGIAESACRTRRGSRSKTRARPLPPPSRSPGLDFPPGRRRDPCPLFVGGGRELPIPFALVFQLREHEGSDRILLRLRAGGGLMEGTVEQFGDRKREGAVTVGAKRPGCSEASGTRVQSLLLEQVDPVRRTGLDRSAPCQGCTRLAQRDGGPLPIPHPRRPAGCLGRVHDGGADHPRLHPGTRGNPGGGFQASREPLRP